PAVPPQAPLDGVRVYRSTAATFVLFTGVSVMAPGPEALTPVSVPTTLDVQLNVVVGTVDVGSRLSVSPLQMLCMKEVGGVVMTGFGLTVTVMSRGVPGQPPASGVMRYTTVPSETPSVTVSAWLMRLPVPLAAPVTFVALWTV